MKPNANAEKPTKPKNPSEKPTNTAKKSPPQNASPAIRSPSMLTSPLVLGAIALFLITRLIIIFVYAPYITDVHFYHEIATLAISKGQQAYRDFLYGYPPLSLILIYLPRMLGSTFEDYRFVFQIFSFVIDAATFYYLLLILSRRLKLAPKAIATGLAAYSLLGLFQGHIIYDRIDLFLLLTFCAAIYHVSDSSSWRSGFAGALGLAWKVIPVLWLPVVGLMKAWQLGARGLVKLLFITALPTFIFLSGYDSYINGHMFKMLGIHNERGIQIESVWATPFMLRKTFDPSAEIKVENNHGAQHLGGAGVPGFAIGFSKFFGFLILAGFYLHFIATLLRLKSTKWLRAEENFTLLAFLGLSMTLVLFLATQRVLSTNFIGWLLPIVAIQLAWRPKAIDFALAFAIFALTYVGFDLGYWKFVAFDPIYVSAVAARNVGLVLLSMRFCWLYKEFAEGRMQSK